MSTLSHFESFVKVCGVTNVADAQVVIEAGATALGVLLVNSPRRVSVDRARAIADAVGGRILLVAVVRGDDPDTVEDVVAHVTVDALQVHGPLEAGLASSLRERGVAVIKSLSIDSAELFDFDEDLADAVLVDGHSPGSGETHSWAPLAERVFRRPVIGAGGLTPANVGAVIDATGLWGVDVATGVERAPGLKDRQLVLDFVATAQRHFEQRKERGG